jgi:hypothetical protein
MTAQITPDLHTPYEAVALYLVDADSVEYMRRDVAVVYRRVDWFLTLALDMKTKELTGFRLKGFRNFFLKHLKPRYRLLDEDFIPLVSVIEEAVQVMGDQHFSDDPTRKDAYQQVRKMAFEGNASIEPIKALAA